jgi:GNAT superfamily N-acetyltransferase
VQSLQPLYAVAMEGLVDIDAMNREQAFDPVDVLDSFADQIAEIEHLARLWYDGWHRTHAPLVPPELTRLRTIESFRELPQAALPNVRVVGPLGAPIDFYALKCDELHLLFVSPEAHGSGVAAALIADPEAMLAEHGVETAWLACAVRQQLLREGRLTRYSTRRRRLAVPSHWKRGATRNDSHARIPWHRNLSAANAAHGALRR